MTALGRLTIVTLFLLSVLAIACCTEVLPDESTEPPTSPQLTGSLQFVGCYDPAYSLRQKYHHHINSVTLASCVNYCRTLRTRFAGVEASDNFCYCGGDIPEESIQRNNTLCNVPCPDDPRRNCGGDWLMTVYDIRQGEEDDVADVKDVDFLIGLSAGVRLYHYNSTTYGFNTLMNTNDWAHGVDYHFSKNLVFAWSRQMLYKATLDPKRGGGSAVSSRDSSLGKVMKNVSSCDGFAVDWVDDRIYWADCKYNGTSIKSMSLNGDAEHTVISLPELTGKIVKRMEVDPYKRMLFWTVDGVIQSCDVYGEGYNPNVSGTNISVRAIALDLQKRRVFFVGAQNQSTSLLSVKYTGDDEVEHLNLPQFRSVYGLGILGEKVLWINYANVRDVIFEASLNLTRSEDVKMIKTIDRAVWHMRVVHPSLQQRPSLDPCLDKGCAHSCVARSATSARCECPPGESLHHDGVSCLGSSAHPTAVYKGCYSTQDMDRTVGRLIFPFLPDHCIDLCYTNGFYQSGLDRENSICYCGEDMQDEVAVASVPDCSPCEGFPQLFCGGESSMGLYEVSHEIRDDYRHVVSMFDDEPLILVAGDGGVYSYNRSEDSLKTVIEVAGFTVTALDYSLKRREGYAIWDDTIFKFPLLQDEDHLLSEKNATMVTLVDRCMVFAVDWVHGMLFYPDCLYHRIISVNLHFDHFPEETIVNPPEGAWALDMRVDPYKGLLFWTTGATLWSCRLDGRSLRKVVPEFSVNRVSSLSLDLPARRIFFFGADKEDKKVIRVFFVDYDGTTVSHSMLDLVDEQKIMDFGKFDHHLYFIKRNGSNSSMATLMSTKLEFSQVATVYLSVRNDQAHRLRLVHPRLQSPGKPDLCTYHGCSHLCVVEATGPRCYCPRYHELDLHNNRTCSLSADEEHVPIILRVVLGLMLVLMVLLTAGVLMCLSDKLWTQMHHTVVTLSTPGATTRSFVSQRTSDTENLI